MEVQVALVRAEAALERNRINMLETAEPITNSTDAHASEHDLEDSFINSAVNSTQPNTPVPNIRSTRASRGAITPGQNRNQNRNQTQTQNQTPNVTNVTHSPIVSGSNPNRRSGPPAQAPYTQVTMPTVFKTPKPLTELTIVTISALKRALERHLRMPGNHNLVVHLYASEYFSYPILDKIETTLNSYYGSTIAEVLETEEFARRPPTRDELEQMLPTELFEELDKCFMPFNRRDYELKLGAVVAAAIAEKSIGSHSMVALPYWQLVIENVHKHVRTFLAAVPEKDPVGEYMVYWGGLRPNIPLGLKGLVQTLVKPWMNEEVLAALRDTFTVNERQIKTLGAWMNEMDMALTRLRKNFNPIASIASACSRAESARRKVQTTKNIASTSLNALLSADDMDQIAYQLETVDSDLDTEDSISQASEASVEGLHNSSDGRRPQTPTMGAGKGEDNDQVCFRTLQGLSCDTKNCRYSHDQGKICKYLNTCLKRFEGPNRQAVKNVKNVQGAKVDLVKNPTQDEPEQPDAESETEE